MMHTDVMSQATYDAGTIPPETMGWRLQRSLAFAGVSVQEMADELGVSRGTISRWCNDKNRPRRSDLRLWALRCGVPFDWLIGDELAIQRHKRPHYQHQLDRSDDSAPPTKAEIQSFLKRTPLVRSAQTAIGRSAAAS